MRVARSFRHSCARVGPLESRLLVLERHINVDVRRRDVRMSKQILDRHNVGTVLNHMSRKTMPERQRRNVFDEPRGFADLLENDP